MPQTTTTPIDAPTMPTLESISDDVQAIDKKLSEHIAREEQERLDAYPGGHPGSSPGRVSA